MGMFDKYVTGPEGETPPPAAAPAPAPAPAASSVTPGMFDKYSQAGPTEPLPASAPEAKPVYRGGLLPVTKYSDGSVHFDPLGAGPIGALRQAFTLPGRVASGETKVDPSNPEFIGETLNFAGAVGPTINPMVRSGDRAIAGVARAPRDPSLAVTPSSEALLKRGGEQLDAFRNLPIKYDPAAFGPLSTQMEQDLLKAGVLRENSPQLYAFLDTLRKNSPPPGGPTLHAEPANLMAMRENLAGLFGKQTEHQKGVGVAFERLNDFIEKPPSGAVLAGSPAFLETYAPQLYAEGRANYAAGKRAGGLDDVKRTADFRAASANSGANTDNSLRSRIASLVLNSKKTKGFTDAEIAALEAVPLGSTKNNILRAGGNLLGGGGGLGAGTAATIAGGTAAAFGLPTGLSTAIAAVTPAVGALMKSAAGKGTKEALDEAIDMTKRRSPLFKSMGPQDLVPDAVRDRDAIARALMQIQSRPQGVPVPLPVLPYDPNRV